MRKKNDINPARRKAALLAPAALSLVPLAPAAAQETAQSGDAPPPEASAPATPQGRQSYPAADFTRFAPRNALDMLRNVPGFQIRSDGGGARGLGQASDNVLVNGQRLAAKSDSLYDQLARIPAGSVVRIDIVDGAVLAIPGLSGQVADVITRPDAFSGQFNWRGEARPQFSHPGYLGGEVSVKGLLGKLEYSAAIANDSGRGGLGGPYRILAGDGSLRERRDGRLWSDYDAPKLSAGLKFDGPGGLLANLNASYRRQYDTYSDIEDRHPIAGPISTRALYGRGRNYNYEIGGDVQAGLAGGQLKLIGLNRYEHGSFAEESVLTPAGGGGAAGGRYAQLVDAGEVIGRAEYSWRWGRADWQIATEVAFNRLDKDASLFDLAPGGSFIEVPFPEGDGGVREERYETSFSYGRPLTPRLSLQLTLAGERSTIRQTGPQGLVRSFLRPKGSLSLAWVPEKGLDLSLKIERAVGQLDFGDFLGRVFLDRGNQNNSNFELVPAQSWNIELAAKKDLGRWGSTNLRLFDRRFTDFVDLVPLPGGGEGRGNIDRVRRHGLEWTSTINLDPLGFAGAKIDGNVILQRSRLTDPLTGFDRQLANLVTRRIEMNLRHDVPRSDWAWGAGFEYTRREPYYRLGEVGFQNEGPVFDFYFIEHKNVRGLTVRLSAINFADARRRFYRTVYEGRRGNSPIAFIEDRAQLIGPIFRLSVKGSF